MSDGTASAPAGCAVNGKRATTTSSGACRIQCGCRLLPRCFARVRARPRPPLPPHSLPRTCYDARGTE
eukprot:5592392-Pyramimonas_sp.AAC.1